MAPFINPGLRDVFGEFRKQMLTSGSLEMTNVKYRENDGDIPTHFAGRPPARRLAEYTASWDLGTHRRTFALIVEDMEGDYHFCIDYVIPNALRVLEKFREILS